MVSLYISDISQNGGWNWISASQGRLSSFRINFSRKFLVQHFNQCPNCGKSPRSARVQAEQRRLMHLEKGECPGFENSDGQSTEKLVVRSC